MGLLWLCINSVGAVGLLLLRCCLFGSVSM